MQKQERNTSQDTNKIRQQLFDFDRQTVVLALTYSLYLLASVRSYTGQIKCVFLFASELKIKLFALTPRHTIHRNSNESCCGNYLKSGCAYSEASKIIKSKKVYNYQRIIITFISSSSRFLHPSQSIDWTNGR